MNVIDKAGLLAIATRLQRLADQFRKDGVLIYETQGIDFHPGRGIDFTSLGQLLILVLALYRSNVGFERIYDSLLGGVVAIVFAVLLFPADPLQVLRNARVGVSLLACRQAWRQARGRRRSDRAWPMQDRSRSRCRRTRYRL